jgi:probable F420-dependent oxidoreductase
MKLGVVIPQPELGPDPENITEFVKAVEKLGYDYTVLYEIVLKTPDIIKGDSAHPESPDNWHDPFILISYLSAQTTRLRFSTGVTILPSRQTIHIAKQAAGIDRLSGGRLRLGVSVGWNRGEFKTADMKFENRGRRIEEQIKAMRALWESDSASFKGRYHKFDGVSLGIHPVQNPIPVWMGGYADPVLKRTARMCDGWCGNILPYDRAIECTDKLKKYLDDAGRKEEDFGISFCATLHEPQEWRNGIKIEQDWEFFIDRHTELGATHLEVSTSHFGSLKTVEEHVEAITNFKDLF